MPTIPSDLLLALTCPLTRNIMCDPVVADDGETYERDAIEAWITAHGRSPLTNISIPDPSFRSNRVVQRLVRARYPDAEALRERNSIRWFDALPNEILLEIFLVLSFRDLVACTQVSRRFFYLGRDYSLWDKQLKIYFGKKVMKECQENEKDSFSVFASLWAQQRKHKVESFSVELVPSQRKRLLRR
mmetsp:Transcript_775/g.2014  ORF Transcript_775/g.2014 Transcript_775/m.2014 type:complete len:187 (-) Transcript_775:12-572(-)